MLLFCLFFLACDPSLWQHVYNSARLKVIQPCVSVTGTIQRAVREDDGDFHVWLKLDPQFKKLLTKANYLHQKGHLVIEPICSTGRVTQTDTIESKVCNGFAQHIFSRSMIQQHVTVTGAYVLDMEHGGWAEIHPITAISVRKP